MLLSILAKGEKRIKKENKTHKKERAGQKKRVNKLGKEKRKEAWKPRDRHFHTKETLRGVGEVTCCHLPLPDPHPTLTLAAYQEAGSHKWP